MIKKLFKLGLISATIGFTLGLALSFLNAMHPAFDTLANFRYHFAIATLMLSTLWLFNRQYQIALTTALVAIFALNSVLSGLPIQQYLPRTKPTIITDERVYSLIAFNIKFNNEDRSRVVDMVLREDPDIFMALEFSHLWSDQLYRLKQSYKHVYNCTEWKHIGGSYIFSKFPFIQNQEYCHDYAALGTKQVQLDNVKITIGIVHLRWPWPASQPKQIEALKPYLNTLEENALIIGDFNAATWTHAIRSFAKAGNLRVINNIGMTWLHELLPISLSKWIGLPIDNAMTKGKVNVISAKSLAPEGSDHLPLKIEFVIRKLIVVQKLRTTY